MRKKSVRPMSALCDLEKAEQEMALLFGDNEELLSIMAEVMRTNEKAAESLQKIRDRNRRAAEELKFLYEGLIF